MKISELSETLNVSEMTIHRDLKPLLDEEFIIKTFGGISLKEQPTSTPFTDTSSESCVICMRLSNSKLAYRLILHNGKIEMTCCAHCGLIRHSQIQTEVAQAITYDFFRETTVSAPLMHYVLDTSLEMGCCEPQVIAFERLNHAEKFVKGFGGEVLSFSEAMITINKRMNDHCCKRHQ